MNEARETSDGHRIELVYFTGCPSLETARANVRKALRSTGRAERWTEWDLEHGDTPAGYRRYGSPTVLVEGRDVAGDGDAVAASGLSCSASGAPSADVIARALAG